MAPEPLPLEVINHRDIISYWFNIKVGHVVLLVGIEAQHVLSQDGTAIKEVGQRDVDRLSC